MVQRRPVDLAQLAQGLGEAQLGASSAAWPPTTLALPRDIRLPLVPGEGGGAEPGGAGADGTRSPGASSWGASTLSIIDRQDLAEGGDLVDCGKEVEYRINYPSARRS